MDIVNFILGVFRDLTKRVGTVSLLLFVLMIYSIVDPNFISNLPLVENLRVNAKQFESISNFILITTWAVTAKSFFSLIIPYLSGKLGYQIEYRTVKFVKSLIYCGWGWFILIMVGNMEFLINTLNNHSDAFFNFIKAFTFGVSALFVLGAALYGLFTEK